MLLRSLTPHILENDPDYDRFQLIRSPSPANKPMEKILNIGGIFHSNCKKSWEEFLKIPAKAPGKSYEGPGL